MGIMRMPNINYIPEVATYSKHQLIHQDTVQIISNIKPAKLVKRHHALLTKFNLTMIQAA